MLVVDALPDHGSSFDVTPEDAMVPPFFSLGPCSLNDHENERLRHHYLIKHPEESLLSK